MRPRAARHLCLGCHAHRARFRYRGHVRADRDHTLCFRCYRAEMDRQRARRLAEFAPVPIRVAPALRHHQVA